MSKLRVAVIGVGHLGRIHARLLAEASDVELVPTDLPPKDLLGRGWVTTHFAGPIEEGSSHVLG